MRRKGMNKRAKKQLKNVKNGGCRLFLPHLYHLLVQTGRYFAVRNKETSTNLTLKTLWI